MSYKTIDIAPAGQYLDRRPRHPPLPKGVEARLLEATAGGHGRHHAGDRWVEYFYENAEAERAHRAQRESV